MASRMMALAVRNTNKASMALVARSSSSNAQAEQLAKIGNREVVGFGWNGEPMYMDRPDYPMPAIRFKENTPDVLVRINQPSIHWLQLLMIVVLFLGFERKGEGRLEEAFSSRKESSLPCIILSDLRRNVAPNRRMETTHRSCFDCRFIGHLRFIVDGIVR